jgi:hypothetical protein
LLASHTPEHRAKELEGYYREVIAPSRVRMPVKVGGAAVAIQND